eukprot:CAMPEP_0113330944 /NCGR_PEP_ID=MMETSP0010_2-20120614/22105_1 /TAXON_ID=216773 ORGANISM="Corethron hystrix, Strain 308" /NCGR_SAMPLE_ID=MMETSP0010_2 /ASSEMBLY_ACC=CAM_ASM_000155 /LENGTH=951 /DNA_ID=CAMNT_0000193937 /DNA_START=122 /DNA_END=2977 /DNA_ORIENTATION=- /assembly_acc=CAM_ASM_000155
MGSEEKPVSELTSDVVKKETEEEKKKKSISFQKKGKDEDTSLTQSDTLSDEDRDLKERLESCVTTLTGIPIFPPDATDQQKLEIKAAEDAKGLAATSLNVIATELRTATSSMTAVPKPLKFLRPHYSTLCECHAGLGSGSDGAASLFRARIGDVLSVLSMTMGAASERKSLQYRLGSMREYQAMGEEVANSSDDPSDYDYRDLGTWGHEYSRSLAGEIGSEYSDRVNNGNCDPDDDAAFADLLELVDVIVPFHVRHNAEVEAVDLLVEVQRLKRLLQIEEIDESNYGRICLYILRMASFMSDPEDLEEMLTTALELYRKNGQHFDALRMALRLNSDDLIPDVLNSCKDPATKKQMCILLGRHRSAYVVEDDDDLNEIVGNEHLSGQFLNLARDLDVMDPKTPEDIYKSHLAETGGFNRRRDVSGTVDSARANLASTFVNAFVNAGFGQDKLMTPENSDWLYKNKDHGMMSAAASLGAIFLWNVEVGLNQVDKFLYSSEDYVKAGAALAVGILSGGVRNDGDPALALLEQHLEGDSHIMKCASATGLGIAYAGSANEEVANLLLPLVENTENADMLEVSLAALALGIIYVGKCDDSVGGALVQRLMEASEAELDHKHARFLCLGLGLLFLGKMEKADAMLEAVRTVEHKISKYAAITLETCAYAGTGNVLKVQEMLHQLTEHLTEDAEHQAVAVIGISLMVVGEDVGSEMALRAFDHLLHYCELPIKRSVPLALALLHVSQPDYAVIDTLSRLTHDPDAEIAQNAIMGLGVCSAGTNNSRVAGLLRQLSEFYGKDAGHLFCVRIAQGLLHMGKGLMTISPFHSDRTLTCAPALGSLLVFLHACLDMKGTLLDKTHYLLYYFTCAMSPRMLITVDEDMTWKPATVRVGQAVETVGVAGRPKSITGFQTHTTPVLLGAKDRAELGTEEFLTVGSILEGIVIMKDNPDFVPEETS